MFRPIALLVLFLATAGGAASGELVFPPGSRIGLVPPDDMKPARGLAGFRNEPTGAAIALVEMPQDAYPSLAAGFTDEALRAQGYVATSRTTPRIGGLDAILVTGQQTDGARVVPKTVLLAAEPTMTALVIGQLPPGSRAEDVAGVEAALRTVVFRPPLGIQEQVAALPFRLVETAGFRPVRAIAGNSLLMTDGPSDVVREASQPILIIAQSFGPAPAAERREAFARQALVANTFIKEATLERSQGFRQDGAEWHEIVAKAKEANSDTAVIVVQTIRFEPDGYLRSIGIVRLADRDAVLPRFRKVIDAIKPE